MLNLSTTKKTFFCYFLIFLVALIFRWIALEGYSVKMSPKDNLTSWKTKSYTAFYQGDADAYRKYAVSLVKKGTLGLPVFPPMTSSFIALTYKFAGISTIAVHILFLLLGSTIPILFGALSGMWFDKKTGIITAWLLALSFSMIILSSASGSEIPALAFLGSALIFRHYNRLSFHIISAVFLGLAIHARTELIIFASFLLLLEPLKSQITWRRSILLFSIAILTLLPWSIRNKIYLHDQFPKNSSEFSTIPFTLNGPMNFFIGNGPIASGSYRSLSVEGKNWEEDSVLDLGNPLHRSIILKGYSITWQYILSNPDQIQVLLPLKLKFYARGLLNGFFHNNLPNGLKGISRRGDIFTSKSIWMGVFLNLWVILSLFWFRKNLFPFAIYAIAALLTGLFNTIIFFGLSRLGAMLLPFTFMIIAKSISEIVKRLGKLHSRIPSVLLIIFSAVIAFQAVKGINQTRNPLIIENVPTIFHQASEAAANPLSNQIDIIHDYKSAFSSIELIPRYNLGEEYLSKQYTKLAFVVDGSNPAESGRLLDLALQLDISNAEAWKLKGFLSSSTNKLAAMKCFKRYLQISPRASDAPNIRKLLMDLNNPFL